VQKVVTHGSKTTITDAPKQNAPTSCTSRRFDVTVVHQAGTTTVCFVNAGGSRGVAEKNLTLSKRLKK